jgi:hypothetical protein
LLFYQLEVAEREKQHMQQRLQQQPQNGISQIKMQELSKQVGRPLHQQYLHRLLVPQIACSEMN